MKRCISIAAICFLILGQISFSATGPAFAGGNETTLQLYLDFPFGTGKHDRFDPRFGLRVDQQVPRPYGNGSEDPVVRAFDMQFRDDGFHSAKLMGLNVAPTLLGLNAAGDGDQIDDQFSQLCAGQMRILCWGLGLGGLAGLAYGFTVLFDDDDDPVTVSTNPD